METKTTHTLIDTLGTPDAPYVRGAHAAEGVEKLEVTAVNTAEQRALYKAREPIYPKRAHGLFRRIKWLLLALGLAVYYLFPWIRWPRGIGEPDQAVLVDFGGRRFYFFAIEIWPNELYYVTGLLIVSALALFLVTALFGRVWCGYACPQTVWTDLFIYIERIVEGDRNKRIKLAKAPWTVSKVSKKVIKHTAWLGVSLATGGAWILYFHDAPSLARDFFTGAAPMTAYMFAGILTFTTYTLAGMMREQVCTYMCPWPRIQGAMTDAETFEVTYRADRGEPRAAHKKNDTWEGRGDCIDCLACVAVCPMGIDIRDGDQLECINCALCIDACDDIMRKVGRPTGLIAYDTADNAERRESGAKPRFSPFRARTIYYAVALALVSAIMVYGLLNRSSIELNVLRDRSPNFVRLSDGSVRNAYTIKILNKANEARDFALDIEGPDGLIVRVIGAPDAGDTPVLTVDADEVGMFRVFLTVPPEAITSASLVITFALQPLGDDERQVNVTSLQTGADR